MKRQANKQQGQNGNRPDSNPSTRVSVIGGYISSINVEQNEAILELGNDKVVVIPADLPYVGLEIVGEKVLLARYPSHDSHKKQLDTEHSVVVLIAGGEPKSWTYQKQKDIIERYAQYRYRITHDGKCVTNGFLTILQLLQKVLLDGIDSIPEGAIWVRIAARSGMSQITQKCEPVDFSAFAEVTASEVAGLEREFGSHLPGKKK